MFRVFRTFGLALGLLGGVVAAQAPEFAQQYAQRLGGAADELRRQVAVLELDAQATGTTREGAVDRLRASPDQLVARRGEAAKADIARLARLSAQQQALAAATSPLAGWWRCCAIPTCRWPRPPTASSARPYPRAPTASPRV